MEYIFLKEENFIENWFNPLTLVPLSYMNIDLKQNWNIFNVVFTIFAGEKKWMNSGILFCDFFFSAKIVTMARLCL